MYPEDVNHLRNLIAQYYDEKVKSLIISQIKEMFTSNLELEIKNAVRAEIERKFNLLVKL